ncbi:MAG TPA: universal stress protein [Opitutales bacterium]|nr:universal stress protein [Opitutales bacterium]
MKLKRILIAVDASPHSLAALEEAAALAAQQGAELVGVFVEDSNLLRLAELPFARELMYPHILGRRLDAEQMRIRLREIAEEARHAISKVAYEAEVSWSFKVRRGSVFHELLAAAEESDLLVLGKASHFEKHRNVRLGQTAARLLVQARGPAMVLQHGDFCRGPALVVCDGSPECMEKLPAAIDAAMLFGEKPTLVLLAEDREKALEMKEEIETILDRTDLSFRRSSPLEKDGIVRLAHEEESGVVILVGLSRSIESTDLPEMLARINCPVLVYR